MLAAPGIDSTSQSSLSPEAKSNERLSDSLLVASSQSTTQRSASLNGGEARLMMDCYESQTDSHGSRIRLKLMLNHSAGLQHSAAASDATL